MCLCPPFNVERLPCSPAVVPPCAAVTDVCHHPLLSFFLVGVESWRVEQFSGCLCISHSYFCLELRIHHQFLQLELSEEMESTIDC